MNDVATHTYIIAIISLLLGGILGALLHHFSGQEGKKKRKLAQELDQVEKDHLHYQRKVSDYIAATKSLSEKLQKIQSELSSHLAEADARLFQDSADTRGKSVSTKPSLTKALESKRGNKKDSDDFSTPRDYVTDLIEDDEAEGMLSEKYGFNDSQKPQQSK